MTKSVTTKSITTFLFKDIRKSIVLTVFFSSIPIILSIIFLLLNPEYQFDLVQYEDGIWSVSEKFNESTVSTTVGDDNSDYNYEKELELHFDTYAETNEDFPYQQTEQCKKLCSCRFIKNPTTNKTVCENNENGPGLKNYGEYICPQQFRNLADWVIIIPIDLLIIA
jgi:hypothetical protein